MITIITGTPGAGKTLYAIDKLLRELVDSQVPQYDARGGTTMVTRRILSNINGLLIDHELIDEKPGGGLADWHLWCKPGDVICFDEVQHAWRPRANGSKVPDDIAALETHRHKGVDFILITQNPMQVDKNVCLLAGRHLHIRRIAALGASIVYEWDHCSRSLLYSKSLKKSPWKYDKKVFQLYKSAELHTKPKISIPPLMFVVLFAIVAAAYLIPNVADRITSKLPDKDKTTALNNPTSKPGSTMPALPPPVPLDPNPITSGPRLDDLIMTGYIGGAVQSAVFQWVPAGQPRYSFTVSQLVRHGMTVTISGECRAEIKDSNGQIRKFACMPGVPLPETQQQDKPDNKPSMV